MTDLAKALMGNRKIHTPTEAIGAVALTLAASKPPINVNTPKPAKRAA